MGKSPLFLFCEGSGAGRQWLAGLERPWLPFWGTQSCLACSLPALSPWLDMIGSPGLHPSVLGMPQRAGTLLGTPSVVTGIGQHAVMSWGKLR